MATPNYVKFQRGTSAAYTKLKNNNGLDSNTLYFIYENASATSGNLYMGDLLIASETSYTLPEALDNLNDVLTAENSIAFLMRDSEGTWKKATPAQVLEALDIGSGGDTLEIDSNEFVKVSGELQLKGFSDATNNQVLTKVDGSISWATPTDYSGDISELQTKVGSLETVANNLNTTIATAISNANHLTYAVVGSLPDIASAETNKIYLVPNNSGVENDSYSEMMVVNGAFEKLGEKTTTISLSDYYTKSEVGSLLDAKANAADLTAVDGRVATLETTVGTLATTTALNAVDAKFDNYVLTTTFNTKVGDLSEFTSYVEGETDSIVDMLNVLDQRLTWSEITE